LLKVIDSKKEIQFRRKVGGSLLLRRELMFEVDSPGVVIEIGRNVAVVLAVRQERDGPYGLIAGPPPFA
jgi:hypothetical protein